MSMDGNDSENDDIRASEGADSAFFLGDAALRGDTHRLARLLLEDLDGRDNWLPTELGAILKHQLGTLLESELSVEEAVALDVTPSANQLKAGVADFRGALFSQAASLELLQRVKEYAKARLVRKDPCFPTEIARVLYYGSVLAARGRFGERISSLTDAQCRIGVDWVLKQEWIEPEVLAWFRSNRELLSDPD